MTRRSLWLRGALATAILGSTLMIARAVPLGGKSVLLQSQRDAIIANLEAAIARGDDGPGPMNTIFIDDDDEEGDGDADDPVMRALWQRLTNGPASQQSVISLLHETEVQKQREHAYAASAHHLAAVGAPPVTPTTALQWLPLGPQSALSEWNGSYYDGMDSGRVATIRMDPSNPATAYIGAIGGGIWRTADITITDPVWTPLTSSLGTMFIGSFDIDPTSSNVIHAGLGDFWEGNPGGVMVKTLDSGVTWSAPVALDTTLLGVGIHAVNTRTVRIDPNNANTILVASDVGLFRSTDGGTTYNPIDLPNTAPYGSDLEGMFSIVYTGINSGTGQSTFLASGIYACPGAYPPSFNQPTGSAFVAACPAMTTGNLGDIWRSVDGGATWTSLRVAGAMPLPTHGEVGRINLATVPGATDDVAVVYAIAANQTGSLTDAVMKSTDGGASYTVIAQGSSTIPSNPTPGATGSDCMNLDIGHGQSMYDIAIAVDPGNANNVLIGGNLCGARTNDGGATWVIVSDWLAFGGAEGPLPYVHADWHAAAIARVNGRPIALAGSDGGIFNSFDVFDAQRGADAHFFDMNAGLDTHLPYSVGSGDPTYGTAKFVLAGMQDNGTRIRVSAAELYLSNFTKAWNQIQGGDGFGAAASSDSKGQNVTLWGVANGSRVFCRAGAGIDCTRATRTINDQEMRAWVRVAPPLPSGDANGGFAVRFWPLYDSAGSVITNSNFNLWKISTNPGNTATITRLVTSPAPPNPGGYFGCGSATARSIRSQGPQASPFTYTIGGVQSRVYGLPLSGGCNAVVVDPGLASGVVTVTGALTIPQVGVEQVANMSGITFPRDPAHMGGTDITKTYIVSSTADFVAAPITTPATPISAATGHVFKTIDGGATWTPLHGNGTGFDLPNVRVYVIRFDPSDPTDQTLWAGTDLGLYRSTDQGATWVRYGSNLPMVRVQDLFLSQNGSLIRVAMYGRGVWEIYPRAEANGTGLGDFDRNGVIDFQDIANLANRFTTTTASTELPIYDTEVNLTEAGGAAQIDENDLTSLLAKIGGAP